MTDIPDGCPYCGTATEGLHLETMQGKQECLTCGGNLNSKPAIDTVKTGIVQAILADTKKVCDDAPVGYTERSPIQSVMSFKTTDGKMHSSMEAATVHTITLIREGSGSYRGQVFSPGVAKDIVALRRRIMPLLAVLDKAEK
ncbi:MAG: hypothetical protein ACK5MY_02685 [Jhaorihella sp.]